MTQTAEIEVVCPGMLEILSVGKGDIKITIDTPEERDNAKKIIEEMLAKGYTIFVEGAGGKLSRVKRFNAKKMVYVIGELVEPAPPPPAKATRDRDVPISSTRATAIGRTAGG